MDEFMLAHRDSVVALLTGFAVFCATLALTWRRLFPDVLGARTRQLAEAWQSSRASGLVQPVEPARRSLLSTEPKRIYEIIVRRLKLGRFLRDGATAQRLEMAGLRGRAPLITFLAMLVVMPIVTFGVTAFYVFVVIKPDLHLLLRSAMPVVAAGLGYYLPALYVNNRIAKRQKSIIRAWPNALDLLMICVEAGMSIEHAFRKVADEIRGQSRELAEELALTTAELSFLPDRRTAYENLGRRTDMEGIRSVVSGLMQSEQHGTPLGTALRVLSQENRNTRMSLAEKKAAALSPKLTVPMILFFLPVLFAVIITPAVIQILEA